MKKDLFTSGILLITGLLLSPQATAAVPRITAQKSGINKTILQSKVDISAVKDSTLIMADDYAVALAEKPELASVRLNAFKRFYDRQPEAVRDTVSTVVFNYMVDYVEQGKNDRADAFKKCFLKIAKDTDPNLGPLYAMEIATAKERFDTAAVIKDIALLDDYARRMNVDYDQELAGAREWINYIRTRKPLAEELTGVWVSADLLDYYERATEGKSMFSAIANGWSFDDLFKQSLQKTNIFGFYKENGIERVMPLFSDKIYPVAFHKSDFVPLSKYELEEYGYAVDEEKLNLKTKKRKHSWITDPVQCLTNEASRWLYAMWYSENGKSFNPEITAGLRQTVQNVQATVAGHYSRSKYNFGDRLAANALASGFSALTNGIISMFTVSKDKIWSKEINFQLQHPKKLFGRIDFIYVESRSDRETPKIKEQHVEVPYYKWEPSDNVFFISLYEELMPLYSPSKDEKNRMSSVVKKAKKFWDDHRDEMKKERFPDWFNRQMFSKLQNKAGDGVQISQEIADILEI